MLSSKAITLGFASVLLMVWLGAQDLGWAWAQSAGGNSDEAGNSIATDSQGNLYVTGYYYSGTISFGAINLISGGSCNAFVAKMSPEGNWLWAKRAWGASYTSGHGIAVDPSGNVYLTGFFQGTAFFGPFLLTSNGWSDIYVAKLNTNGSWIWAVSAGGNLDDVGLSVSLCGEGNIHLTGFFQGTASFGSTQLSSMGNSHDIFVAKLDEEGNWLWALRAGGTETDNGTRIAVDSAGNSYLTGFFKGNAGFGATNLTSSGYQDIFVAAVDPGGNWLWAKRAGGPDASSGYDDAGFGLAVDSLGNIFLTGCFLGTADFGSVTLVANTQFPDLFVARLDPLGNWNWAIQTGGSYPIISSGLALGDISTIYLAGKFSDTAVFDSVTLTSLGGMDIFVAKIDPEGNWLEAISAGGDGDDRGLDLVCGGLGSIYVTGGFFSSAVFGPFTIDSEGVNDVFVAKLSMGVDIVEELTPGMTENTALYGAWPNPARSGENVSIKAKLAERQNGTLSLFDLRGQIVSTHPLHGGVQQIRLKTSGLGSGVYFYQLRTNEVKLVKKLVIVR